MKTMLSVAYEFMSKNQEVTFDQLWKEVVKQMSSFWEEHFVDKTLKQIEEMKISEFYTLLTVDGKFARNKDDKWVLIKNYTYEEIRQMKVNIGETLD